MNSILKAVILTATLTIFATAAKAQSGGPYELFPLTPCRVVDTRNANSTNGGPALGTVKRDFSIRTNCSIPSTAKAVAINVTVVSASAGSWLTIWPSGQTKPFVSTINFDAGTSALANGALVGLSTNTADLSVTNAVGTVHVIIDVTGYYQ